MGTVEFVFGGGAVPANVICLAVDGKRATIRVVIPLAPFPETVFFVEDNGSGGDRLLSVSGESVPAACPLDPPAGATLLPVLNGDIEVVDAQPFPTATGQCKNGGWRNFPGFKNQGDCVSFVATGDRSRPPGSG